MFIVAYAINIFLEIRRILGNSPSRTLPCLVIMTCLSPQIAAHAAVPAAPVLNTATAGNKQIVLAWSASSGATSYSVFRGTAAGAESGTALASGITATTWTDTTVTNGTPTYYKLKAVNSSGSSGLSNEKSATASLPAPTLSSATAGNGSVVLVWTAVANATSYKIYRATTAGGEGTTPYASGASGTSYTDTGATNGSTFYYKVAAVDATSTGPQSGEKSAAPVLPAPTLSTAAGGNASVTLAWTSVTNATSYSVFRGTTAGGESTTAVASGITAATWSDSGLSNGTKYYYKIKAVSAAMTSAYSNELSATTNLPAVTNLQAAPGSASVTLSWSLAAGASSYSVYRGTTAGGESTTAVKTGQTTSPYTDTGRTNGQIYYYYIKAVYPGGTSVASNEVSATPLAAPAAPTNLTAVATPGQIALTWTASANAASYSVYRGTSSNGESATAFANGIAATSYADLNAPCDGSTYFYYVKAVNAGGTSAKSGEASAKATIGEIRNPSCVLCQGADGLLYGTSVRGGANNNGTIFSFNPSTGQANIIYSFSPVDGSGFNGDGACPYAGVIQAADGDLYGTTKFGGTLGGGTLFKLTTTGGFTALHQFDPNADGSQCVAELVEASDGQVYGTLSQGTASYGGVIFRVSMDGTFQIAHGFGPNDGAASYGGLVDRSGVLYGATYGGGNNTGEGVIYSLNEASLAFSVLTTMNSGTGPSHVMQSLTLGPGGVLYGLASGAVQSNTGQAFSTTNGFFPHTLYQFGSPPLGNTPSGALIFAPDGFFYSTTQYGGTANCGTVFRMDTAGVVTYLHSFTGYVVGNPQGSDGAFPQKGLIQASDGYLYGTAFGGATNSGSIYRISPQGNYAVLRSFDQTPASPANVTVTSTSSTCVQITWSAVYGATSYHVKRGASPGGPFSTIASPTTTSYQDCSLTAGTTYYYEVTAVIAGGESGITGIISVTPSTLPNGPSDLSGVPGNTTALLQWSAIAGVTTYNVNRATVSGGPYSAVGTTVGTTFTNTGLTNGTTYYYTVSGATGVVTQQSNQVAVTPTVPGPASLIATAGNAQVVLTWGAISGATSYKVKRSLGSGGPYTTIASPTTTTYTDTGVTNGTTYYYVVSAVTGSGETGNSNEATATPAFPPATPGNLVAVPGNASVALTWYYSPAASSYAVKRSTVSGSGYVTIATVPAPQFPANSSFTDTSLTNYTTYYYVVTAQNAGGVSSASNEANATPLPPPAAPTNLTASPENEAVRLLWTITDQLATSYTILRATNSTGPYSIVTTLPTIETPDAGSAMAFDDLGIDLQIQDDTLHLMNGTTYYYAIVANGAGGTSPYSAVAAATPFLAIPAAPLALRAQAGDTSVSLLWSESSTVTSYQLYRSTDGVNFSALVTLPGTDDEYVDSGLLNGATYSYAVSGVNASGEGARSPVATATPSPSISTPAQVIQAAINFCQAIGQPVSGTPTATFPAPLSNPLALSHYWQQQWEVDFPGQADLSIVDGSNIVTWYYSRVAGQSTASVGIAQPSSSALSTFNTVLAASGLTSGELNIGGATTTEIQVDSPATEGGHEWQVDANRTFQGIDYFDQSVTMISQAETGLVQLFVVRFPAPSPTSNVQAVTSSQANTLAAAALNNANIAGAILIDTTLSVVQPNTSYTNGGTGSPIPGSTKVAWSCCYSNTGDSSADQFWFVWIDASNGSLLGGKSFGTSGSHPMHRAARFDAIPRTNPHSHSLKMSPSAATQTPLDATAKTSGTGTKRRGTGQAKSPRTHVTVKPRK